MADGTQERRANEKKCAEVKEVRKRERKKRRRRKGEEGGETEGKQSGEGREHDITRRGWNTKEGNYSGGSGWGDWDDWDKEKGGKRTGTSAPGGRGARIQNRTN